MAKTSTSLKDALDATITYLVDNITGGRVAYMKLLDGTESGEDAIAGDATNGLDVDVTRIAVPSTVVHGQNDVTTAGTEEALASTTALTSGVTVKAKSDNTGNIYVGANPVTSSTGFILAAGEQVFIETDDLANVYIDAAVSGEGVSYIGA